MNISPVSFKSLMCFTIKDGKAKAPVPDLVKLAFNNNKYLSSRYRLDKQITKYTGEAEDGTVFNAFGDFCKKLDKLYKNQLPKGSNRVILTEAPFFVSPREIEQRYFITAATYDDEEKILKTLSKNNNFYTVKLNGGKPSNNSL